MNLKYHKTPLDLDQDVVSRICDVLAAANFTEEGVLNRLNCTETIRISQKELPRLLRMTNKRTPLDTLIRLFVFGVHIDRVLAEKAVAPMTLRSLSEDGLLKNQGETVSATLQLVPYGGFLITFDWHARTSGEEPKPDCVPGPGLASSYLLNATIRSHVGTALDLGTGCGIQGLACARHCQRVISTDINPRALNIAAFNVALNGLENVEIRAGDLFNPIDGETFDLITMNPPFAISPEARFAFRDGGLEGDGFVRKVVREVPGYLTEGGCCQMVAQWAHVRGQAWQTRLAGWFEDSGCDVWLVRLATQNAETYALNWISETEKEGTDGFARRWEAWRAYYEDKEIEEVSTGIINMRRQTGRRNWFAADEDVDQLDASAGTAIEQGFRLRSFLAETTDDAALLATPLRIAPDAVIENMSRSNGEGWKPDKIVLRHQKGLYYAGNLDTRIARLLGQCNGRRPLGELVDDLAASLAVDRDKIIESTLAIMRRLIERGFVLPPAFCSPDAGSQDG